MVQMCINLNCHLKCMQNTSINQTKFYALNHFRDAQTDVTVSTANERLLIDSKPFSTTWKSSQPNRNNEEEKMVQSRRMHCNTYALTYSINCCRATQKRVNYHLYVHRRFFPFIRNSLSRVTIRANQVKIIHVYSGAHTKAVFIC